MLSRQQAGVRVMHLAEVLAATEDVTVRPRTGAPSPATTAAGVLVEPAQSSATFVGMPAFPEAARAALADTQLRHNLAHATATIRTKRPGWSARSRAGRTCA